MAGNITFTASWLTIRLTMLLIHRLCQHRWPAIAGMVGFRNNVNADSEAGVVDMVSGTSQQVAFGRGKCSFQVQLYRT